LIIIIVAVVVVRIVVIIVVFIVQELPGIFNALPPPGGRGYGRGCGRT
jgi:hypothetical protein